MDSITSKANEMYSQLDALAIRASESTQTQKPTAKAPTLSEITSLLPRLRAHIQDTESTIQFINTDREQLTKELSEKMAAYEDVTLELNLLAENARVSSNLSESLTHSTQIQKALEQTKMELENGARLSIGNIAEIFMQIKFELDLEDQTYAVFDQFYPPAPTTRGEEFVMVAAEDIDSSEEKGPVNPSLLMRVKGAVFSLFS